jgi:uncharacterized protein YqeY
MINIDLMILQAMKDKQPVRVKTYRAIKSEIQAFKTAKNAKPYDEIAEITLLKKMRDQRVDSAIEYQSAGREDLSNIETEESIILDELIPVEPTTKDIEDWLENNNYHTISRKEMGAVIKEIKSKFPSANGKIVAEIVKKLVV